MDSTMKNVDVILDDLKNALYTIEQSIDDFTDARYEKTSSLKFVADEKGIYGKGLQWKEEGKSTKQFTYRANPDRIWTTESIDVSEAESYLIGGRNVLSLNELGPSVQHSKLTTVGTLKNVSTQGNLSIDEHIFYNSSSESLGIGTDTPNGLLSIASLNAEFIIDTDVNAVKAGAWSSSDFHLVTDNTSRLTVTASGNINVGNKDKNNTKVSIFGNLGIGINNVEDNVSLSTAGPIKVQNKKFESGNDMPTTGTYSKGDIIWNSNPQSTGYVGWICIKEGTPGMWKPFGQIGT